MFEICNLWPTSILVGQIEDEELLNDSLDYILTNYEMLVGRESSNDSVLESDGLKQLKEKVFLPHFDTYLKETSGKNIDFWKYRLNGWVASYTEGSSLDFHNHRGSQLSSVLYLIADEKDVGGEICFTDPRQNANRGYDLNFNGWFDSFKVKPKCGQIVIFPSFLYHYVSTYKSNVRLALPVDCFLYTK
jgi:hypothetical protein